MMRGKEGIEQGTEAMPVVETRRHLEGARVSTGWSNRIRPIAGALIRDRQRILVWDDYNPSTGERVAVPLAGGVEFGETGAEAIARELDEEIGATPARVEFLGIFEEIFAWAGQQRHELWMLYDVDLANRAIYETEQVDVTEDDGTSYVARWHDIAEFGLSYRLVPQGLLELIGRNTQ
jgi:ADP-ribose pyrophosphatase YjhB (NUDIX family)